MKRIDPEFKLKTFNCPHCGVHSQMHWRRLKYTRNNYIESTDVHMAVCNNCHNFSLWIDYEHFANQVHPIITFAPEAHSEMPEDIKRDFEEARKISELSPRGAAALLRLCVQKLCKELGEEGKNIDTDIRSMVAKGLPPIIQQSLDYVRVVGNEAVHPGQMSEQDVAATALELFTLVNYIVDDRISRPKKIKALYMQLPESKRNEIAKKDGASKAGLGVP